jgi:hypothetical protein
MGNVSFTSTFVVFSIKCTADEVRCPFLAEGLRHSRGRTQLYSGSDAGEEAAHAALSFGQTKEAASFPFEVLKDGSICR